MLIDKRKIEQVLLEDFVPAYEKAILDGIKDQDHYWRTVGIRAGLLEAVRVVNDLAKNEEDEDDSR